MMGYHFNETLELERGARSLRLKPEVLTLLPVFIIEFLQSFSDKILSEEKFYSCILRTSFVILPVMLWLACWSILEPSVLATHKKNVNNVACLYRWQ